MFRYTLATEPSTSGDGRAVSGRLGGRAGSGLGHTLADGPLSAGLREAEDGVELLEVLHVRKCGRLSGCSLQRI